MERGCESPAELPNVRYKAGAFRSSAILGRLECVAFQDRLGKASIQPLTKEISRSRGHTVRRPASCHGYFVFMGGFGGKGEVQRTIFPSRNLTM